MRKSRPRGRPPKAPEDVRNVEIKVKVTAEEAAILREAARAGDRSLSDWLRRAGLDLARGPEPHQRLRAVRPA
jgi:uncharacterized protein (DUF1778 family)